MTKFSTPAITITLRDLPKRIVITSDSESVFVQTEGVISNLKKNNEITENKLFSNFTAADAHVETEISSIEKTFDIERSSPEISAEIEHVNVNGGTDSAAVNFGPNNKASVPLNAGLHILIAILRGMPGDEGKLTVSGLEPANLKIAEGHNSEYGLIKIRV